MQTLKTVILLSLLSYSTLAISETYIHFGGGLDYVKHDKSDKDYPMLNLKAGLGYKIMPSLGFEFDITAKSTSTYDGSGTCTTTIGTQVNCTREEEISRYMGIGSAIYTYAIGSFQLFAKAGIAYTVSSHLEVIDGTNLNKSIQADEDSKNFNGLFSVGIIKNERHRIGTLISTKYGNSDIGNFNYIGIEYNYLLFL